MTITATVNPADTIGKSVEPIQGMLGFLMKYWWVFLLILLLGISIFLVVYLVQLREKEQKERDSEAYSLYNDVKNGCTINCDKQKIKKTYSLMNLLWFGIPIKWNEHSSVIRNIDDKIIGYYRGSFVSHDGFINFLLYKNKKLGIIEDKFILRYPKKLNYESITKNKKKITKNIDLEEIFSMSINNGRDIKLRCSSIQRLGIYYYVPIFINDFDKSPLDLRDVVENSVADETFRISCQRILSENAKNMRKAVSGNPVTQFSKQTVSEIEQQNEEIDAENEYSRG